MRWLNDELIGAAVNRTWQFYRVKTGPLSFYLALMPVSPYQKALDAFFDVTAVTAREAQWPLVYVYESGALLDQCHSEGLSLSEGQANAKLAASGLLLNWDPVRGLIKYFDAKSGQGLFAARNLANLPSWEWFSPIKEFVHCWALQQDAWLAHAATIGFKNGKALLLVGPGGSGKSTTCVRLILDGNQTCGDDYVLLTCDPKKVVAYSIYRTIKLMPRPNLIESNGFLAGLAHSSVAETGKSVYFIDSKVAHAPLIERLTIDGVCGLELTDEQAEPILPGSLGYPHFAMSSLGQIPVWVDQSMKISRMIYQKLSKSFVRVQRDASGLARLVKYLESVSI